MWHEKVMQACSSSVAWGALLYGSCFNAQLGTASMLNWELLAYRVHPEILLNFWLCFIHLWFGFFENIIYSKFYFSPSRFGAFAVAGVLSVLSAIPIVYVCGLPNCAKPRP